MLVLTTHALSVTASAKIVPTIYVDLVLNAIQHLICRMENVYVLQDSLTIMLNAYGIVLWEHMRSLPLMELSAQAALPGVHLVPTTASTVDLVSTGTSEGKGAPAFAIRRDSIIEPLISLLAWLNVLKAISI